MRIKARIVRITGAISLIALLIIACFHFFEKSENRKVKLDLALINYCAMYLNVANDFQKPNEFLAGKLIVKENGPYYFDQLVGPLKQIKGYSHGEKRCGMLWLLNQGNERCLQIKFKLQFGGECVLVRSPRNSCVNQCASGMDKNFIHAGMWISRPYIEKEKCGCVDGKGDVNDFPVHNTQ